MRLFGFGQGTIYGFEKEVKSSIQKTDDGAEGEEGRHYLYGDDPGRRDG